MTSSPTIKEKGAAAMGLCAMLFGGASAGDRAAAEVMRGHHLALLPVSWTGQGRLPRDLRAAGHLRGMPKASNSESAGLQRSDHPGVFVGILRAGLGPFMEQAAALLAEGADASNRVSACTRPCCRCVPCSVLFRA